MTVKEKLEEVEFFLEEIKKHNPDLKYVKHFFSAFLNSVFSIPDYILAEANLQFELKLSLSETWYPRHFKEKAKNMHNVEAENFYNWWSTFLTKLDETEIGRILKETRDLNTHKFYQKPRYFAIIQPENQLPSDKPMVSQFHETPINEISLDDYSSILETTKIGYLKMLNEERQK